MSLLESRLSCKQTCLVALESLFDLLDTVLDASGVVCSSDESFDSMLFLEGFEDVGDRYQLSNYRITMSIEYSEGVVDVVTSQEPPAALSRYHRSSSRSIYPIFH
jgi:hypothetical protein